MKLKNNIVIAAIALSMTACSSDNEPTANTDGKEYPISLSVGIGDLSVVTRSTSTFSPDGGSMGFFILGNGSKTGSEQKYFCNNEKVTCSSNGQWSFSKTHYWSSDNAKISYIAYYPYREGVESTNIVWRTFDGDYSQNTSEAYDLLWERNPTAANSDNHSLHITLAHACSKLTVNVTRLGSEITQGAQIDKIVIKEMKNKGTFNFTGENAGTWTLSQEDIPAPYPMKSLTTANVFPAKYEAILIPQEAVMILEIKILSGAAYQLTIPSQKYEMGTHYTITIQVGQDQVNFGSITQTPWEEVSGGGLIAE